MEAGEEKKSTRPAEKKIPDEYSVLTRILQQVVMMGERLRGLNSRVTYLETLLPTIRLARRNGTVDAGSVQAATPRPVED